MTIPRIRAKIVAPPPILIIKRVCRKRSFSEILGIERAKKEEANKNNKEKTTLLILINFKKKSNFIVDLDANNTLFV